MNQFITLHCPDPFSDEEGSFNPVHLRATNVVHVEGFSGPFQLQAYGPDGRIVPINKHKQIIGGSLVILAIGGYRIVRESPSQVLEIVTTESFS